MDIWAWFQFEAISKHVAVNARVKAHGAHVTALLGCESAESEGCSFNFPGQCQTIFQSGCAYTPSRFDGDFR